MPRTSRQKARVVSRSRPAESATWRTAPTPGIPDTLNGEAGAAAAGGDGVRVLDLEGLAHQVVDEVDHRAAHIDQRQIVDQDRGAILLDGDIVVVARVDQIELVGKAGAAAAFDGNAQRRLAGLARD